SSASNGSAQPCRSPIAYSVIALLRPQRGEPREVLGREGFRPCFRVDAERRDLRLADAALERARERLAAHREQMRDEPREMTLVGEREALLRAGHEPHDARPYARRRRERSGTDVE